MVLCRVLGGWTDAQAVYDLLFAIGSAGQVPTARRPGMAAGRDVAHSLRATASALDGADYEDELAEDDIDIENDPEWKRVRKELSMWWEASGDWKVTAAFEKLTLGSSDQWLDKDDVQLILDDQIVAICGQENTRELADTLAQIADEEPQPGQISKADFLDIAGAYVYNQVSDR